MTLPAPALVLRRVPAGRLHLARALAPDADDAGGTWWELVDVAAPSWTSPTGVALTCTDSQGTVHVTALAALSTPDGDSLPRLLLELVAALRRTDAVAVEVSSRRPELLAHLECQDADRAGDRLVLRF